MIKQVEYLEGDEGLPFIRILDEAYAGVCVRLGAVSFPDEDEPVMQFQYDIIEGAVSDIKTFEQDLGDFIVSAIEERLRAKSLLFAGGEDDKNS